MQHADPASCSMCGNMCTKCVCVWVCACALHGTAAGAEWNKNKTCSNKNKILSCCSKLLMWFLCNGPGHVYVYVCVSEWLCMCVCVSVYIYGHCQCAKQLALIASATTWGDSWLKPSKPLAFSFIKTHSHCSQKLIQTETQTRIQLVTDTAGHRYSYIQVQIDTRSEQQLL